MDWIIEYPYTLYPCSTNRTTILQHRTQKRNKRMKWKYIEKRCFLLLRIVSRIGQVSARSSVSGQRFFLLGIRIFSRRTKFFLPSRKSFVLAKLNSNKCAICEILTYYIKYIIPTINELWCGRSATPIQLIVIGCGAHSMHERERLIVVLLGLAAKEARPLLNGRGTYSERKGCQRQMKGTKEDDAKRS